MGDKKWVDSILSREITFPPYFLVLSGGSNVIILKVSNKRWFIFWDVVVGGAHQQNGADVSVDDSEVIRSLP